MSIEIKLVRPTEIKPTLSIERKLTSFGQELGSGISSLARMVAEQSKKASILTSRLTKDYDLVLVAGGSLLTRALLTQALNVDMSTTDLIARGGMVGAGLLLAAEKIRIGRWGKTLDKIEESYPRIFKGGRKILSYGLIASMAWATEGIIEGAIQPANPETSFFSSSTTEEVPQIIAGGNDNFTTTSVSPIDVPDFARYQTASLDQPTLLGPSLIEHPVNLTSGFLEDKPSFALTQPTPDILPSSSVLPEPLEISTKETTTKIFSLTTPYGAEISGSLSDHSLTFNNIPWGIDTNGMEKIQNLAHSLGYQVKIDQAVFIDKLQQSIELFGKGELNPQTQPQLYKLFHISNGTADVVSYITNENSFQSLQNLGIFN